MIQEFENILKKVSKKLAQLKTYLEIDKHVFEIEKIEKDMSAEGFWTDANKANQTMARLKSLKSIVQPYKECLEKHKELTELIEVLEETDEISCRHIDDEVKRLSAGVDSLEFKSILNGENDKNNAILSINAGAGGTESCDWANMLLRMYVRWAQTKEYDVQEVDLLPGEEAGLKNVTIIIKGQWAFGYLKAECGVHRLVRISPFDSNSRRHTSFASVDVIPEVADTSEIEINETDLKIDTYRAGGAGGQHVNVTDSAVRITHIPTGLVAQCQNERSQGQNRNMAMKVLKAKLYERKQQELKDKMEKEYAQKKSIEWGSQIRSYVFHPYNMVKDHRTNAETSNTQAVMDGDIDMFIEAYLKTKK